LAHAKGYDDVLKTEIRRRFGNDAIELAEKEADQRGDEIQARYNAAHHR
jgi:hypothetical protein